MKKRSYLIIALALCMLFSGFTRIDRIEPSFFHDSEDTVFGGFTVPIPDYYEETENNLYVGKEKGRESAGLRFQYSDSGSLTRATFDNRKQSTLDTLVKFKTRTSYREVTVAGCPAVTGEYLGKNGEKMCGALIFDEQGRQILAIACVTAKNTSYDAYIDDFMEMVDGITLESETVPAAPSAPAAAPKAGKGGVTPEVKEFWDSYEGFVDEYIDFMKKYMKNPYDLSLLTKLTSFTSRLTDFEEKADKYSDSTEYSDADVAYSLEVYGRIMKKLAQVL